MTFLNLTRYFSISLESNPKDFNRNKFCKDDGIRDLDHLLELAGGWEVVITEIAFFRHDTTVYLEFPDLVRFASVFGKCVLQKSDEDVASLICQLVEKHLFESNSIEKVNAEVVLNEVIVAQKLSLPFRVQDALEYVLAPEFSCNPNQ